MVLKSFKIDLAI